MVLGVSESVFCCCLSCVVFWICLHQWHKPGNTICPISSKQPPKMLLKKACLMQQLAHAKVKKLDSWKFLMFPSFQRAAKHVPVWQRLPSPIQSYMKYGSCYTNVIWTTQDLQLLWRLLVQQKYLEGLWRSMDFTTPHFTGMVIAKPAQQSKKCTKMITQLSQNMNVLVITKKEWAADFVNWRMWKC